MVNERTRTAVVTAAAAGIGAAVARRLAARGHRLALIDIDEERLTKVCDEARAAGAADVIAVPCDVRKSEDVAPAFATIRAKLGPIDILANVVGGSTPHTPIEDIGDERWRATISLNIDSLFNCTRAVVSDMKERRWGRIVNTSSLAGRTRSLFAGVDYTASKGGVVGFTRQLAFDLAPYGIAANVVAPGVIASERVLARVAAMTEERQSYIKGLIPAGRFGTPDDVAAPIAFLCSEEAAYISGAVLDVNGGMFIA
jgi:3-oxoacyl-[acyl-carrier protein] reductase